TKVLTREASQRVNQLGEQLKRSLRAAIEKHGVLASVTGYGSLICLHFIPENEVTPAAVEATDPRLLHLWHMEMMLASQYVTPRGMIALALPHSQADIDGLVGALDRFLGDYKSVLPSREGGSR